MNGWERTPSGLYVPVEVETVPPVPEPVVYIPPRKEFHAPPTHDRAWLGWSEFDKYIESVDGAPCPRCDEPIQHGERHESMCTFSCRGCGWFATVHADGRAFVREPWES